jgi:tRNA G18 (ribose-2'-O)-methylase SpoU
MVEKSYRVLQCISPDCHFRCPAPSASDQLAGCPKCGSPVETLLLPAEDRSWNPRMSAPHGPPVEALLDNIRSSYNVGAMLRTADGAGLRALHLAGTTPTPAHSGVAKTALGAEYSVPWYYHPNGVDAALQIKAAGSQLWALEVGPQSSSIFDSSLDLPSEPILLVVGNEVTGVDPAILQLCDRFFWIPMEGYKRSLNVAIAFGIAIYTIRYGFFKSAAKE